VIEQQGLPVAVYTDRHRIFESPNESLTVIQELAGLSLKKRSLDRPWKSWVSDKFSNQF
jgi:hypothetical protein